MSHCEGHRETKMGEKIYKIGIFMITILRKVLEAKEE